jgi:hypothetical protein
MILHQICLNLASEIRGVGDSVLRGFGDSEIRGFGDSGMIRGFGDSTVYNRSEPFTSVYKLLQPFMNELT